MLPRNRVTTSPGEILEEEFLKPLGIKKIELARRLGVTHTVISEIIHGKRAISPRMAVMLGAALGTTAEFWHGLQADYDLTSFRQSAEGHTAESVETLLATQQ